MNKLRALLSASVLVLGACASDIGSNEYSSSSVGAGGYADKCRVISVRKIKVASDSNAGGLIGAAAGGVAGSQIGGGSTAHILGALGGAGAGALAGHYTQKGLTSQEGLEYVVELDNGRVMTTTQGTDAVMVPGDRCLVLSGQRMRVIPYNGR